MKKFKICLSAVVLSLVLVFSAGCSLFQLGGGSGVTPSMIAAENVVINTVAEADRTLKNRVKLIKEVKDSVVAIKGIDEGSTESGSYSSGVIVDMDRFDGDDTLLDNANEFFIITCHHCVDAVGDISVFLVDENGKNFTDDGYNSSYTFTGKIGGTPSNAGAVSLVGGDPDSDLALLRLIISNEEVAQNVVEAKIMDTSKYSLEVGEDVVAIGNPSGLLPGTASAGIISYIGRNEIVENVGEMELIQIDVQTNPGNSGGALFNMYGELVGITSAGDLNYDGLNFAIPLTTTATNQGVVSVIRQLAGTVTANNYGYVSGRWKVGVTIEEQNGRVYVASMPTVSAAYDAGIRTGDYISMVTVGTKPFTISTISDFDEAITYAKQTLTLGGTIKMTVNGFSTKTVSIRQFIFRDTGVN